MKIRIMIGVLGIMLLVGGISGMAQTTAPKGPPPKMNFLAPLKSALQSAGAPALTTDQETAIQALIKQFREAHRPPATPPQDDASMADVIAEREADLPAFVSSVLTILTSNSTQASALVAKLGEDGLDKLLRRLAGGPGGRGGRGGPDGPPPDAQ